MYNSPYAILEHLCTNDCLTVDQLCKLTNINRTTVVRQINKLNVQLYKHNVQIVKDNKKYSLNVTNSDILCLWNIDTILFNMFTATLNEHSGSRYIKKLQYNYYYSFNQIQYNLKKHFQLTIKEVKSYTRRQFYKYSIMLFTHIFNDYSARYTYKHITHDSIVKTIESLCIEDCSTYEYLIIFWTKLNPINETYKNEIYEQLMTKYCSQLSKSKIITYYKNRGVDNSILKLLEGSLKLYYTDYECNYITRNYCFLYYENILEVLNKEIKELKLFVEIKNDLDIHYFIDFLSKLYLSKYNYKYCKHSLTIVNVEQYYLITNIYDKLGKSFGEQVDVKILPSWKYYLNEGNVTNCYSNCKLTTKIKCVPPRNRKDLYELSMFDLE